MIKRTIIPGSPDQRAILHPDPLTLDPPKWLPRFPGHRTEAVVAGRGQRPSQRTRPGPAWGHSPNTVLAGTDSRFSQKETCDKITVIMQGR